MTLSRRDLSLLLPALAARAAAGQTTPQPQRTLLPQKVYHSGQIPYTGNADKKGRRFMYGTTHGDFNLEVHETVLGPGIETHPPHKHEHEELVIVVEGRLEVHLEDQVEQAETGSIIYFGSNRMHNAKNTGTVPCRYCVIELRGKEA